MLLGSEAGISNGSCFGFWGTGGGYGTHVFVMHHKFLLCTHFLVMRHWNIVMHWHITKKQAHYKKTGTVTSACSPKPETRTIANPGHLGSSFNHSLSCSCLKWIWQFYFVLQDDLCFHPGIELGLICKHLHLQINCLQIKVNVLTTCLTCSCAIFKIIDCESNSTRIFAFLAMLKVDSK